MTLFFPLIDVWECFIAYIVFLDWIKKLDTDLQNKGTFDVHPTNPQVDIQPTWSCEYWIRNIDLVRYNPKPTTEQPPLNTNPPLLVLLEIYHIPLEIYSSRVACIYSTYTNIPYTNIPLEINSSRVACIYSTDRKCQGMMTLRSL